MIQMSLGRWCIQQSIFSMIFTVTFLATLQNCRTTPWGGGRCPKNRLCSDKYSREYWHPGVFNIRMFFIHLSWPNTPGNLDISVVIKNSTNIWQSSKSLPGTTVRKCRSSLWRNRGKKFVKLALLCVFRFPRKNKREMSYL